MSVEETSFASYSIDRNITKAWPNYKLARRLELGTQNKSEEIYQHCQWLNQIIFFFSRNPIPATNVQNEPPYTLCCNASSPLNNEKRWITSYPSSIIEHRRMMCTRLTHQVYFRHTLPELVLRIKDLLKIGTLQSVQSPFIRSFTHLLGDSQFDLTDNSN